MLGDSSDEPDPLQYFWDGVLVVLADQVPVHSVPAHRLDDLLVARKSVGDISSREEGGAVEGSDAQLIGELDDGRSELCFRLVDDMQRGGAELLFLGLASHVISNRV